MKKTFITLLALSGVALATDFTSTSSTDHLSGFGGLDVKLDEESWLQAEGVDYDTVIGLELTSITLNIYNTWYTNNNMTAGFGIGIYEKTGDSSWVLVGKTDWFKHNTNSYTGSHEFKVLAGDNSATGGVTLSTGKTYTLAFHAGETYFNNLAIGTTRSSMTGAAEWKNNTHPGGDTDSLAAVGLVGASGANPSVSLYQPGNSGVTHNYTPNITLSGNLVPEPTTATLSLLALAGLAARRRRK